MTSHPPTPHSWVDAAPFRAHLSHLSEATGIWWPVLAIHAGVPTHLAARLLFGRGKRRLNRLPTDCARRLLALTPEVIAKLTKRRAPAAATVRRLHVLQRRGWTSSEICHALGCPTATIHDLLSGAVTTVSLIQAHSVTALLASSDAEASGRTAWAA